MNEEDEAFEALERAQGWRKRQIAEKVEGAVQGDPYVSGWNSALEMAAFKITHDLQQAFPRDTLASFAVFIKGLKKP